MIPTDVLVRESGAVAARPVLPSGAEDAMQSLLRHAVPNNTALAVRSDWEKFVRWCGREGHEPFPAHPDLIRWFITSMAAEVDENGKWLYAPATISRWVSSINTRHVLAGVEAPGRDVSVGVALRALRRSRAAVPARRAPLLVDDVRFIVACMRDSAVTVPQLVSERRDSALLLMGLAGALRRSELVALEGADVEPHPEDGLYVRIRRSKSDRESRGRSVTVPFGQHVDSCPVCALRRWVEVLEAWERGGREAMRELVLSQPRPVEHECGLGAWEGNMECGLLFRRLSRAGAVSAHGLTGQSVCAVVKKRAAEAGFTEQRVRKLGAHSLRVGFVTQAVRGGATTQQVMLQTGHTDERMVRLYSRQTAGLTGNAVTALGL